MTDTPRHDMHRVMPEALGGWISGPGWYDKDRNRRNAFIAEHPEWVIAYISDTDHWEAVSGSTETQLITMTDHSLGALMDRLEAKYTNEQDHQEQK
jgi:hypothetical protein